MKKKWNIVSQKPKKHPANGGVEELIKRLLKSRGLKTKKQIKEFLNPPNPYKLTPSILGIKKNQLTKAIKRIKKAISSKESIIIYGDYDADGITSTAILWETLYSLGAKAMPFIPHREKHGYGLNKKGINSILKLYNSKNLKLLITVDNGIVANQGIEHANKKGIDVIITDHHQSSHDLPKAHSIIHSTQTSGAGVAWFFAKEIYQSFHKTLKGFKASNSLELASIGTITDMMPMLDINRSLVKFGLKELKKSNRPGIKALCSQAGAEQKEIGAYHVGFIIGPRLNAMGRLEDATESLRLLCTKNDKRADDLAGKLGVVNRQRQGLTQTTFEHAKNSLKLKVKSLKLLFISHSSYNPGIIGLVAGRLVDEFYRPAVVISEEKEYSKGSVRSIKGFNVIKSFRKLKNVFEDLGGHPMAAGFTVKTKRIKELKEKLEKLVKKEIKKELLKPVINIDLEIDLNNINWNLFNEIEKFAPFGLENRRPVFVSRNVEIVNVRAVGREQKHLKLKVKDTCEVKKPREVFDAIGFNLGSFSSKLSSGNQIDICYNIDKNVWNGKESLQLMVKDIKIEN